MFLKNGVLVNRFIVLDFLIAIIFLIGGYFAPFLPSTNSAF
ncbi:putative membrane protein [Helicobacter pylori Hp H-42]|uniref:Membrane protein n=1 Tax=Helicobacter pylori Hp H-42 TaxID=992047 RepID=A0AB33XJP4_HELPX|nr:putative membrane protein [Helicobacter pylori Hp H-42]